MEKIVRDYYAKDVIERLCREKQIAIFGARIVAVEVASCLMGEPYNLDPVCFVVSQKDCNPSVLLGKPVISLEEAKNALSSDILIVIAAMEKNLNSILEGLRQWDFHNFLPVTFESDLWSHIRGNYFMEYCKQNGRKYLFLEKELLGVEKKDDDPDVKVYVAKCHMDRHLQEDMSRFSWEIPIQVGAELTSKVLCEARDNEGDNISEKNREYCELTGLYWIWKNTASKYAGLCHYRRHFELDEEQILKLSSSDIDTVVTIPILNFPSVAAVYEQDHILDDWKVMMEGIEKIFPEYLESARDIQNGIYYYGYNMFIARKMIFDDYCRWLFEILSYCETHCKKKENPYQNRYMGFLAERLFTIYIKQHEKQYKIVHAKKHFVEN